MKKMFKNLIIIFFLLICQKAFCNVLTSNDLNKIIIDEITPLINYSDYKIKINGIPNNSVSSNNNLKVEILPKNQEFSPLMYKRIIIKDSNNNLVKSFPVNIQTLIYQDVLVASDVISYGDIINYSNTTIERKEISKFLNKTISEIEPNTVSNRNYQKGNIILKNSIKQKAIISKNSDIDIVFLSSKGLKIKVRGKALKDGAIGDMILVRSDNYNKTYNAEIIAPYQVIVRI